MSNTIVTNSLGKELFVLAVAAGAAVLVTTDEANTDTYLYTALDFVDEAGQDQIVIGEHTYCRPADDDDDALEADQVAEWRAKIAVATYLGYEREVFGYTVEDHKHYGELIIVNANSGEYAVGTDEEADKAAAANIKDSLWAFRSSFLASFTDLPEEIFTALQDKCEGANEPVLKLVERADGGLEEFTNQAVSADGRGHFLSSYDGNENEVQLADETTLYIYRTN